MRPNNYPSSAKREAERIFDMFSSAAPHIGEWAIKLSRTMKPNPKNVQAVFPTDCGLHRSSGIEQPDDNMDVYDSSPKNSL